MKTIEEKDLQGMGFNVIPGGKFQKNVKQGSVILIKNKLGYLPQLIPVANEFKSVIHYEQIDDLDRMKLFDKKIMDGKTIF
jgi:hypothetical protein